MEINYEDLKNISAKDVIRIASLTESDVERQSVDVQEAIIELNDGKSYRVISTDENREKLADAILGLATKVFQEQEIRTEDEASKVFQQYEVNGRNNDDIRYQQILDEYDAARREAQRGNVVKVVGGTVFAGAVATLQGCGLVKDAMQSAKESVGERLFTNQEETPESTQQGVEIQELNTKPEIKGTTLEFYFENAPESEQKQFEQNFYPALEALNTRMADHTYTSETGVFGKLGLTVQQARLLYIVLHNYSDEQIAQIMGGELFNQIPMFDNDGNPVLDDNGNQLMEDSTVIIQQGFVVFQRWFMDAPLTEDDINAVMAFFDTDHDKEIVRKFISGHNAILNATTDKEREEAAKKQRALYDEVFASDITDSDTKVSDEATAFLSRTMYVADYDLTAAYNYTGEELIYKNGIEKGMKVTTNLFGDQFDAWFRSGMQNFDSLNYLKHVGVNPDEYYVNKSTAVMSITDATCDYLYGKIISANEYIRDLQNADIDISQEQQLEMIRQRLETNESMTPEEFDQITTGVTVVSKLDTLKEVTYPITDIEELMRIKMMDLGKYPVHTEVFAEKWEKMAIDIKNKYVNTRYTGSKGATSTAPKEHSIGTLEVNRANAKADLISRGATASRSEQMLNEAEADTNQKQGILGKDNAETANKAQTEVNNRTQQAQKKYDEIWNYAYNWYRQHGPNGGVPSLEYTYMNDNTFVDKYSTNGVVTVKEAYIDGKEAGIAEYCNSLSNKAENGDKKAEEEAKDLGIISGGENKIDKDLSDYIIEGSISTDKSDGDIPNGIPNPPEDQQPEVTYEGVWDYAYNWYLQHGGNDGTPELESTYLSNDATRDEYLDGKNLGIAKYNEILEIDNPSNNTTNDTTNDSNLNNNTGDNNTTDVDDTKTPSNDVNNNNDNNGSNSEINTPDENPSEDLPDGFLGFVDGVTEGGGDTNIFTEEDILDQIEEQLRKEEEARQAEVEAQQVADSEPPKLEETQPVSDEVLNKAIDEVVQEMSEVEVQSSDVDSTLSDIVADYEEEQEYQKSL